MHYCFICKLLNKPHCIPGFMTKLLKIICVIIQVIIYRSMSFKYLILNYYTTLIQTQTVIVGLTYLYVYSFMCSHKYWLKSIYISRRIM